MAAHKAMASSQNGNNTASFSSPNQTTKIPNMTSPSYQPGGGVDSQNYHSPQPAYKGTNYTSNFSSPPKQTIHSLLQSNQHSKK
jgi:hypothetical protein